MTTFGDGSTNRVYDLDIILRWKYEWGTRLGHHPWLFFTWRRLFRPDTNDRMVSNDTEVVIEGFPRCGNTFAVAAFIIAQNRPVRIAHYTYKIAQVAVAARKEIPTLIVIRHPADATISLVIRYPFLSLSQVLKQYLRYYKGIGKYRHSFVMSNFHDVIRNYGDEICKLNEKFGTDFYPFEHNIEKTEQSFRLIEEMHRKITGKGRVIETAIARPSAHRDQLKMRLREELQQKNYRGLLSEAEGLYSTYLRS